MTEKPHVFVGTHPVYSTQVDRIWKEVTGAPHILATKVFPTLRLIWSEWVTNLTSNTNTEHIIHVQFAHVEVK